MERQNAVLVVDDDQFALRGIAKMLRGERYQVVTAASGSEAIDLLEQDSFDLVLTDLKMPGVDGLGVLRRAREIAPQAVVLILTGYASVESAIEALREGAYDYLVKPCSADELKLKIERGIERVRLTEDHRRAEEALRRAHHELETRVQERTAELAGANEALKAEIAERVRAEEEGKQYIRELSFLSQAATEFVELPLGEDIYRLIGEKIRGLADNAFVVVNSFDEASDSVCVHALLGLGKRTRAVMNIMGGDPVGTSFKLDDEAKSSLSLGKLLKVPGGIYDLSPGIPKLVCQALEKLLGLGDVYSMGFVKEGNLLGNVAILLRRGTELRNKNIIEIFANQASVALQRKRAEEALRESEERYRSLFEGVPVGIYRTTQEGRILDGNPALVQMLGCPDRESLLTVNVTDTFMDPEERRLWQVLIEREGSVRDFETRVRRHDGKIIWVEDSAQVVRDADGQVLYYEGSLKDITERVRAEEELGRYRGHLEELVEERTAELTEANQRLEREIIERARAEEARRELNASLEARTFELQVLYELSHQIGYTLDYEKLFRLMIEHLHQAVVYDVSAAFLVTEDVCEVFIRPTRPILPDVQEGLLKRLVNTFAAMSGRAVDMERLNIRFLERPASDETAPPIARLGSAFQVPLIADQEKEVAGLLFVGAEQERAFTEAQVRILYTVAHEASTSIQRLRALMAAEHQRLESLMRNLPEGVLLLDAGGRIVLANPAGREYLALLTDEGVEDVLTHLGERPLGELLGPPAEGKTHCEVVLEGSPNRVFEVMAQPLETGPQADNWVLIIRDITERKRAEEELAYMATHDALTGLPNRWLFNDRLNLEMTRAQRNQQSLAVILFDLDHFKDINDTLGHSVGDSLLQIVGDRLTSILRKSDTAARMGGDEFTLLLPEIVQGEDAAKVAQKILEAIRKPFVFDGHELHIAASVGIAIYPTDGEDADTLMKNADIAMYRAKDGGRDNYQCYTPSTSVEAL